jgi:uncharacterized protein (TIGR02118 family)
LASPVSAGDATVSPTMVNVLVLFGRPVDEAVFDTYFNETHRGVLGRLPHVEQVTVNRVAGAATGTSPFHVIVELRYSSEQRMQDSLNSAEGQAMARDFQAFGSGGVTILFCETQSEA